MTPKANATAFRIWQHCEPIGWDITIPEIAEALDVDARIVSRIINAKGWSSRVRAHKLDTRGFSNSNQPGPMRQSYEFELM